MTDERTDKAPGLVVLVFYALGMATLLPWNFFITAESYWQYKLRNVSLDDGGGNSSDGGGDGSLTPLQLSFTPTLVVVSNVFCTVFMLFNSAVVTRVGEGVRLAGSLVLSLATMFVITIFTFVTTDQWQLTFFIVTMILVALLNICVAVLQGSSYGLAGQFPASCMSGMLSGQAISGIFSSLARIVSLAVGEEPVTSGIVFFTIADVFLVASIAGYFYLTKTTFYHEVKAEAEGKNQVDEKPERPSYMAVLKKVWLMGVTLGGTLFITLAVYPAVLVYVTSVYPPSPWTTTYFQPTITFLLFNVADTLGREVPRVVRWPGPQGWGLHVFGAARLLFLPLLLLCHGDNKTFPTLFNHDAYYIVLIFLFAYTNGYVGTLAMIYYTDLVEPEELEVGGAIMAAMLGVGMVVGALLSPPFVALWGPT